MSRIALNFLDQMPPESNLYQTIIYLSRLSREISRLAMDTQRLNLVEECFREAGRKPDELKRLTGLPSVTEEAPVPENEAPAEE